MTFYGIEVREGRHQVYETTDGIRRIPIPTASFGSPREAIRYAEMRELRVSPLRATSGAIDPGHSTVPVSLVDSSAGRMTPPSGVADLPLGQPRHTPRRASQSRG